MSLWRELIDHALDDETLRHEREQMQWIAAEPSNPQPFCNLARLRRMQWKEDDALALFLEAVRLDAAHAESHVNLTEMYAIRGDYAAAWRHARAAHAAGESAGVELLARHGIKEA